MLLYFYKESDKEFEKPACANFLWPFWPDVLWRVPVFLSEFFMIADVQE